MESPLRVALLLMLSGAGGAAAIEVEFGRCRLVAEATARLACYDAIAYAAPAAGQPMPAASAAARPVATAADSAAGPAAVPAAADRFGLTERRTHAELASITSSVSPDFFGWGPKERIRLENGQVWEVMDGSSGSVAAGNRRVTVRRGALGSFFLDFEGLNTSPRVKRVR